MIIPILGSIKLFFEARLFLNFQVLYYIFERFFQKDNQIIFIILDNYKLFLEARKKKSCWHQQCYSIQKIIKYVYWGLHKIFL